MDNLEILRLIKEAEDKLSSLRGMLNKKPYKRGDLFFDIQSEEKFILALVSDGRMGLISLEEGNRFRNPVRVSDPFKVSEEEFEDIGGRGRFIKMNCK